MKKPDGSYFSKEAPVVGIPRALSFYKNAAMWVAFLESLGVRVLISAPTNKEILDDGLKHSIDESCLPTKIFLGHVKHLVDRKPDFIFVSRQQDFRSGEVLCTKFWGLPDICRNTFDLPDGTRWLELNISPTVDGITDYRAWKKVGWVFTSNPFRIWKAYRRALKAQKLYIAWLECGKSPMNALELALEGMKPDKPASENDTAGEGSIGQVRIALLGHSYLIHDEYYGLPIIELLRRLGVKILIVEDLDKDICRSRGRDVSPHLYWTYNREIVGAADHYIRDGVDGVVLVEAFPCGPDALVFDYITRVLRGPVPIVRIVMDELQALTGIQTRMESFTDIIRMRRREAASA